MGVVGAGRPRLEHAALAELDRCEKEGIGVSIFSCWEVAMLHARGRLQFSCSLDDWITAALAYPGVELAALTVEIVVESCRLPDGFAKDPADRILVATARSLDCPLVTADEEILRYPHVKRLRPQDLATA